MTTYTQEEIESMVDRLSQGELSQDEQIELLELLNNELDKILAAIKER